MTKILRRNYYDTPPTNAPFPRGTSHKPSHGLGRSFNLDEAVKRFFRHFPTALLGSATHGRSAVSGIQVCYPANLSQRGLVGFPSIAWRFVFSVKWVLQLSGSILSSTLKPLRWIGVKTGSVRMGSRQ